MLVFIVIVKRLASKATATTAAMDIESIGELLRMPLTEDTHVKTREKERNFIMADATERPRDRG